MPFPPTLLQSTPSQSGYHRKPQVSRSRSGGSEIVITGILACFMTILPYDPSILNAIAHIGLWTAFLFFGVGTRFLWQPGPTSWFLVMTVVSFGSWTFFYLTGRLFFFNTQSFIAVCGSYNPTVGFEVDAGCFLFTCIAWMVTRFITTKGAFDPNWNVSSLVTPEETPETRKHLFHAFIIGGLGALVLLPRFQLSGVFAQPLYLIGTLFPAGLATMLLKVPKKGNPWWNNRYLILLVSSYGLVAFVSSGAKGTLFLNMFLVLWLYGMLNVRSRYATLIIVLLVSVGFVVTLPVFQASKDAFQTNRSTSESVEAFTKGLDDLINWRLDYTRGLRKEGAEATWEYMGIRLCVAGMTQTYHIRYSDTPRGLESLFVSLENSIPRIFNPGKMSISVYYNDFARTSGIGAINDFKTQRQPSFIDESVSIWGGNGFWIGGIVFGLYLSFVEWFCIRASTTPQSLVTCRFMTATLGQLPYFGVMFGSTIFVLIFVYLFSTNYLSSIWKQTAQSRLTYFQARRKDRALQS